MLKGLAITPPVLGRISIGKVVEKNGKRLPEKDDQFTITSQVQGKDGWLLHPLNDELRQGKEDKLRSIPVRLLFNKPELNFRADYTLFDRQSGRPICVGNGETCKRVTPEGMQSLPCPSPDACPLAKGNACKPYGRLNVVIGDGQLRIPHHRLQQYPHPRRPAALLPGHLRQPSGMSAAGAAPARKVDAAEPRHADLLCRPDGTWRDGHGGGTAGRH